MGQLKRIFKNNITGDLSAENSEICEPTNLVYDSKTKIIYYKLESWYMAPYISEKGKFCRFIDDKIVEVN